MLRVLAALLAFLMACGAGLYRPPAASDAPDEVLNLLQEIESRRDVVNIVMIGSSYTGFHVLPDTVAEAAAPTVPDAEVAVLALPGMNVFEADALLDRVLALRLPRLRWVVIEYGKWDAEIDAAQFRTVRAVWWQSPRRTARLMQAALAEARDDGDLDDAFPRIARAGYYLFLNYSRVGRGLDRRDPRSQTDRKARIAAMLNRKRDPGFDADFAEAVRKLTERNARPDRWKSPDAGHFEAFSARALADQIARVRGSGAEPLYVLPPSFIRKGVRPDAPVLDFDDPAAYPELYRPEDRADLGHLAGPAADLYSRMLGKALARHAAPGGAPGPGA